MSNTDSWGALDDDAFEAALENESVEAPEESLEEAPEDFTEEEDESLEEELETSEDAAEEESEDATDDSEESEEEEPVDSTDEPKTEQDAPTPDKQLEELFKPFKASGREVQVKSVDEIKKLMSMGVDYSNKLQGFKAHRKTIKMLENNEIDEAKLNYFIDLSKGNPDAIKQLLKDNNVDPMDVDLEEDSSYKPSDYSVSDNAVELDDVISRIQETPSFATTSDIVTNQWDQTSKQELYKDPRLIENLNAHVANGTYERVMQEVSRAKLFGGLQGLSDLEAYNLVGEQLSKQSQQQAPAKVVSTKPTKSVNTNKDRKLRASSSKSSRTPKASPNNWAAMSDAEFEKLLNGE